MHQIRREKRTTISEVIVHGKRNVKQKRNWFYFNLSVESSSFIFNNFKTKKKLSSPLKVATDQFVINFVWFYRGQSVFLSKFVPFHSRTVKLIVTALMLSLSKFSLFLPHLRTLAHQKRSENCLRFETSGPSLCWYALLSRNIISFLRADNGRSSEKTFLAKRFAHVISEHYRDFEHAYVY